MKHLTGKACAAVKPIFTKITDVSVLSCTQGHMGEAWCNDGEELCCAKIILGDFCFFDGDASHPQARELVAHLPQDKPFPEWYLVGADEAWYQLIEEVWGERAEAFDRYSIRKDTVFDKEKLRNFAENVPEGYTICRINGQLYHRVMENPWSWDGCIQFDSEEDFLKRGLGFVVVHKGEVVAQASSYSIYDNGLDITISTRKDHRQKGLAKAAVSTLILAALERGWYPNWDARTLISVSLAEQLGYRMERPYRTYCLKVK